MESTVFSLERNAAGEKASEGLDMTLEKRMLRILSATEVN